MLILLIGAMALSDTWFFYRDNFSTHFPIKQVSGSILRDGRLPFWNETTGGGQPLAGNPNSLTFYPDTLAYLILPARVAFDLHFLLHLVIGWLAMASLLRKYGIGTGGSRLGATLYLLSGPVLSTLNFYNLVTAVALIPMILLVLEHLLDRPDWIRAVLLGALCGLAGLGGEPVIILGITLAGALLAIDRLSRRVVSWLALALATAVIVVSPLLISWFEIASETERGAFGYSAQTVLAASLQPVRMLEMLIGPFRGMVTDLGPSGLAANAPAMIWPPLLISVFIGAIIIPALSGPLPERIRRHRWIVLLMLVLAAGSANPLLRVAVEEWNRLRIIRYPEKLTLILTVSAVVAICGFLQHHRSTRRVRSVSTFAAVALFTLTVALMRASPSLAPAARFRLVLGSAIAVAVLLIATLQDRIPASIPLLAALTLAPLVLWAIPAATIDWFAPYRLQGPEISILRGQRVNRLPQDHLILPKPRARARYRISAATLDPLWGTTGGISYVGNRSPDGMHSYLSRIVAERIASAPLPLRIRYLRMLGCRFLLSDRPLRNPELRLRESFQVSGNPVFVFEIVHPQPFVSVPERIMTTRSASDAVPLLEGAGFDPATTAVAPPSSTAFPTGPVHFRIVDRSPGRIRLRIEAARPATLVINETYFRSWKASTEGGDLRTFPANLDRLGVVVPAGTHLVEVEFGRYRRAVGVAWAASLLMLLSAALLAFRSSRPTTVPAR